MMVIGLSGYLGYSLARFLKDDHLISGCYFTHNVYIPDVQIFPVPLDHLELLDPLIQLQMPDAVIYCAGVTDKRAIHETDRISENINVVLPLSAAALCSKIGAKFIFFSCAEIYDGTKGEFTENSSELNFAELFGKQKVSAEAFLKAQVPDSTILRLGRVMGLSHHFRPRIFDRLRTSLMNQESFVTNRTDAYSFLSKDSFNRAVKLVVDSDSPEN